MTQKTQNILTTIVGVVITAVNALVAAFAPHVAPYIVVISGAINEVVNLLTEGKVTK